MTNNLRKRRVRPESPFQKRRNERELKRKPLKEEIERLLSKEPEHHFPSFPTTEPKISREYLRQLQHHIRNLFGIIEADGEAAYFLFLIWLDCYGDRVDYDLKKGIEQFKRPVSRTIRVRGKRGRKESTLVGNARDARANGESYRDFLKRTIPDWHRLTVLAQQKIIRRVGDAVRKSNKRVREKQGGKK